MGAQEFTTPVKVPKEASNEEAFRKAREEEAYENGHGGYTGTLAEKTSFVMVHHARSGANAKRMVEAMMGNWGSPIPIYRPEVEQIFDDKWGPAGAIRHPLDDKTDGVIFFGWASS